MRSPCSRPSWGVVRGLLGEAQEQAMAVPMTTLLPSLLGLSLGMRHALEPDHLAAVSTLASRRGAGEGLQLGIFWGQGILSLFAVGALWCCWERRCPREWAWALAAGGRHGRHPGCPTVGRRRPGWNRARHAHGMEHTAAPPAHSTSAAGPWHRPAGRPGARAGRRAAPSRPGAQGAPSADRLSYIATFGRAASWGCRSSPGWPACP